MNERSHSQNSPHDRPDEVLMALLAVHREALKAFSEQKFTLAETQVLAETIVQVRDLLADWAEAENGLGQNEQLVTVIKNMKECYLELEGMIKERRNDLIIK
jgi:hypothetical protein